MTMVSQGKELAASLLLDPDVIDDPLEFYRRLREEAPVWRIPGTDVVTVSSFALVTEAVGRIGDFSSNIRNVIYRGADGLPELLPFAAGPSIDVLATADPPVHTRHRSAVFPELMSRRMATLRGDVEAIARERLDLALAGVRTEFMADVANAVPIRVLSRLIGWEDEDPDRLLAAAFDSTSVVGATRSRDDLLTMLGRSAEIIGWIGAQLAGAHADGAPGLLGVIAGAIGNGDLDQMEGLVIMTTLLSAGGESTTSLIGNAVHILATDPELQARLRDEPEQLTPFIEEVLRLEAPFRYHLRHANVDSDLAGVTVPAGSTVLLLWGAANRDPAEYDRPDEVVLDRPSPRHHLGFGRGIHLCVGAPLARLEADVVLSGLLERTDHIALDPDHEPVRENSLMVRRFTSLPLALTPKVS